MTRGIARNLMDRVLVIWALICAVLGCLFGLDDCD
jgi:hypothetical protein